MVVGNVTWYWSRNLYLICWPLCMYVIDLIVVSLLREKWPGSEGITISNHSLDLGGSGEDIAYS